MSIMNKFTGITASLAFALVAFSTTAAAEDLVFTLNNHSTFSVIEFHASPNDVANWEDDILGQDILAAGDSVEVTIADGRGQCEYDLRFKFEDGDVIERPGVNLCDTGSYTLTN
jgi:hypothetical protein